MRERQSRYNTGRFILIYSTPLKADVYSWFQSDTTVLTSRKQPRRSLSSENSFWPQGPSFKDSLYSALNQVEFDCNFFCVIHQQTIKAADISTVRKLAKPPHLIMRIMDCVLLLFRRAISPVVFDPERSCVTPSWSESLKVISYLPNLLSSRLFGMKTTLADVCF